MESTCPGFPWTSIECEQVWMLEPNLWFEVLEYLLGQIL